MSTQIGMHNVKEILVGKARKPQSDSDFYVRKIFVRDYRGDEMEVTLFSRGENEEDLAVKFVDAWDPAI